MAAPSSATSQYSTSSAKAAATSSQLSLPQPHMEQEPDHDTSARSAVASTTPAADSAILAASHIDSHDRSRLPLWLQKLLRTPLLGKIILADLFINLVALWMVGQAESEYVNEIMVVALIVTLTLNAILVYWALMPLKNLEATAIKVSRGDLGARVPQTFFADRNIARIGNTLNTLLEGVTADRERMRQLASQVISAGDQERAHIARELHDSTAQALSALDLLLTAALKHGESLPPERLRIMLDIVGETLREVRTLSHNVHPRVLDDLGLVAALEWLAHRTRDQSGIETRISSDVRTSIPPDVASVLYRVAQEAIRNALRHASPTSINIRISATETEVAVDVIDDGPGFDPDAVDAQRHGMGLFIMRERLALVGGHLEITDIQKQGVHGLNMHVLDNYVRRPNLHGTRVRASVPLTHAAHLPMSKHDKTSNDFVV